MYTYLNEDEIKKKYAYWRLRIFYSLYVGYVFFYLTRKSFNFVMVAMEQNLAFTNKELGLIGSALYIAYGISKFTSGILSDRSNPRYFLPAGLFMTGILNILFGYTESLWVFVVLWFLNGWFQGWGWPPITKQLTHWFSQRERAFWWGVCSSSHNIGGWLASLLPFCMLYFAWNWRHGMICAGWVAVFMSVVLFERLRGTPVSMGLPTIEVHKQDPEVVQDLMLGDQGKSQPLSLRTLLYRGVLSNPSVWALAVVYFFVYLVRTAMNDWTLKFFVEHKGYTNNIAGLITGVFEVGGFLGTLAAGYFSDKLFQGKRLPYSSLSCLVLIALLPLLFYCPAHPYLDGALMVGIGFFVFGPQMLVGLAAAEYVDKRAAGASNGFVGLFGYLGAACAAAPVGQMLDAHGWSGMFLLMVCATLVAFFITLPILKPKMGGSSSLEIAPRA